MTFTTLGKSKIFTCGRCLKLIVISDPSFLALYEGHFYCMTPLFKIAQFR